MKPQYKFLAWPFTHLSRTFQTYNIRYKHLILSNSSTSLLWLPWNPYKFQVGLSVISEWNQTTKRVAKSEIKRSQSSRWWFQQAIHGHPNPSHLFLCKFCVVDNLRKLINRYPGKHARGLPHRIWHLISPQSNLISDTWLVISSS